MDSSDQDSLVLPEEWSPNQVSRLGGNLIHYRNASKRSWEAIATDILYLDSLPKSYVDREDTRPLSESLRRLATGKQTPNADRLNAVALFLFEQGYIAARFFVSASKSTALASAFNEFSGFNEKIAHDRQSLELVGDFQHRDRNETQGLEVWRTLWVENDGAINLVRMVKETYGNPEFSLNLDASSALRKRNLRTASEYEGCLLVTLDKQVVAILKNSAYGDEFLFFVFAGVETRRDGKRSMLLLECEDVQFPVAAPPSERRMLGIKYGSLDEITQQGYKDRFAVFREMTVEAAVGQKETGAVDGA